MLWDRRGVKCTSTQLWTFCCCAYVTSHFFIKWIPAIIAQVLSHSILSTVLGMRQNMSIAVSRFAQSEDTVPPEPQLYPLALELRLLACVGLGFQAALAYHFKLRLIGCVGLGF